MEIMEQDYVSLFPGQDLSQNSLFIGIVSDFAKQLKKKVEVFHPELYTLYSETKASDTRNSS
jgi:hypothetical protein